MTNKSAKTIDIRNTPEANAAREIRKARNLVLCLLLIAGLVGWRHLNKVPYRLKVYDENNRIETAVDLFGSYYRPIKEGEDAGSGVRYHSFQDAEQAWERYDSPRLARERAAEASTWLAVEAERKELEQEQQRKALAAEQAQNEKLAEEYAVAMQRWNEHANEQALEQDRQARIRQLAQEQAQAFARDVTVRRAFSPNGRIPRARLVKWAAN